MFVCLLKRKTNGIVDLFKIAFSLNAFRMNEKKSENNKKKKQPQRLADVIIFTKGQVSYALYD